MKRDNPAFSHYAEEVYCEDCPFTDEDGEMLTDLCHQWWDRDGAPAMPTCPTAATYQAACEFAAAHKEG